MNTHPIISLPVAADLTGKEHSLVMLTSAGVNIFSPGAAVGLAPANYYIGTLMRSQTVQESGVVTGQACDVFLRGALYGIHYVTLGSNAAITMGDAFIRTANGLVVPNGSLAPTGASSGNVFTLAAHPFYNGQQIQFTALTGGSGLTVGEDYYVVNAAANTFQIALTPGGAAVALGSNVTAATVQAGDFDGLFTESQPANSSGGIVRGLLK
jgi:hypothetical protein